MVSTAKYKWHAFGASRINSTLYVESWTVEIFRRVCRATRNELEINFYCM